MLHGDELKYADTSLTYFKLTCKYYMGLLLVSKWYALTVVRFGNGTISYSLKMAFKVFPKVNFGNFCIVFDFGRMSATKTVGK